MLVSLPPSSLTAAKQAAIGLYRSRKSGKPKDEWIRGLDQTVANEIDRAYWTKEKRKWPVDLMGGQRHRAKKPRMTVESRQAILDTERVDEPAPLKAEEVQLEHYEGWLSQASRLSRPQGQARGGRMSGPGTSDARSRKGWAPGLTMPLQRSILAAGYTKNQVPEASVPKRSKP